MNGKMHCAMRKSRLFEILALVAGIALFFASCTKEEVGTEEPTVGKRRLTAAIGGVTRAALDDVTITWDVDDKIKVFYEDVSTGLTASSDFALVDGVGSNNATFEEIESNMGEEDRILYAFYPAEEYWEYAEAAESEVPCTLPTVQNLDNFAMPMFGTVSGTADALSFNNCAAVFTVRVKGTGTITSVKMTSTSRYLAGPGVIDTSIAGEPKFRVETSAFKPYDSSLNTKNITVNCGDGGLVLGEEPVEIPIVVPILPGTAYFGKSSLAFEFYNGETMLQLKKNSSEKQPVRNKKLLFPVWEFVGAATGEEISIQIAEAVAAGSDELVITTPVSGDQTIELPAAMPETFKLYAPFTDGSITVTTVGGATWAAASTIQVANMAATSTASFNFDLNGSGVDADFYGVAQTLTSNVARLTLRMKDASSGRPVANVGHLIIDGGSVLSYYAEEPEALTINNDGCIFWKTAPKSLTPGEGSYSYWTPDPYTTSSSLVLQWTTTPLVPGEGTEQSPYLISSVEDWNRVGWQFSKASEDMFVGKYFRLEQDLDVNGEELTKWGYCKNDKAEGSAFAGTFDGNGKMISNFTIAPGNYGVGLFGFTRNATISGLLLKQGEIRLNANLLTGGRWIGGLVGLMQGGTVTGCGVENLTVDKESGVTNYYRVGGLVGFVSGTENAIVNSSVNGVHLKGWYAMGGLIGSIQAVKTTISGCLVDGVTVEHAYAIADDPAYSSGPVIGDMGVSGNYEVEISNMTVGTWNILCSHSASSVAEWIAQDPTVWPYFGEIVDGAVITVDGETPVARALAEGDMTNN